MLEEQQEQKKSEEIARALQSGRGFRQRKETVCPAPLESNSSLTKKGGI